MIVLFDTCIILDYLMDRKPFSSDAATLVNVAARRQIQAMISVKSIMDIHYILKKTLNNEEKTRKIINNLYEIFEVVDSYSYCCAKALDSRINDFEDAMMSETGKLFEVDYLVTRNIKDYRHSELNIIEPSKLVKKLKKEN